MTQQQINTLFAEIEGIKFYHVTTAWPDDSINQWTGEERILWTKFSLARTSRLPLYVFEVEKLFKDPEEAAYYRKLMEWQLTEEETEVLQAIVSSLTQHYVDFLCALPKILEAVEAQKEKVPNLAEKLRKGQAWGNWRHGGSHEGNPDLCG